MESINAMPRFLSFVVCFFAVGLLASCGERPWNNPHSKREVGAAITFSSFSERPKYLDPIRSYSSTEYRFITQIYEPPLQYHYLKRPYVLTPLTLVAMPKLRFLDTNMQPLLAEAEQVSYSEYELQIQPGIHFQPHPAFALDDAGQPRYIPLPSGWEQQIDVLAEFPTTGSRELLAEDYVYQIKRLAHPRSHSPISKLMQEYIVGLEDYVKTLEQAFQAQGEIGFLDLRRFPLAGVQVVDRYTYRIRLRGRYPQFLYWLAMPFFSPMPWEADQFYNQPGLAEKNINLNWYPVGTGPFYMTENNPNRRIVLQRNPNFHGELYPDQGEPTDQKAGLLTDAGQSLPFIKKAIYDLEKESIPAWNKFLQGYYDASGIGSDSFDQAVQFGTGGQPELTPSMQAKGIRLHTTVIQAIYYLGFNMRDPVIGGYSKRAQKLRQALSIAVDMEEYISIFQNDRGVAAHSPLPPGIFGHQKGAKGMNPYVYEWRDGKPWRKSLEVARTLLAEAGYPGGRASNSGTPLVLYFDAVDVGPDDKARLNWYRKQFAKLEIQLVIRSTDYNRFQGKMLEGSGQIFYWGWNADYPDPENFLFLLHGSQAKAVHGGENATNYANPEFDRLFEQMKHQVNSPQRQAIITKMLAIAQQDAPWIWGFYPKIFSLHHQWYSNHKPSGLINNDLKYKRITGPVRTRLQDQWNQPVIWPIGIFLGVLLLALIPAGYHYRRTERSTVH